MPDLERFLKEKLNPVYKAHYALWIYWWPLWRNLFSKRRILKKWEQVNLIREGQTLLDFGCGTGSFTIPAAKTVTERGRIYALDCFPRQLEIVAAKSAKEGLRNIETILSDKGTDLPEECIDVIWMCDVLHEIPKKRSVLEELYRILRSDGILAIYDGMRENVLDYTGGLFSLTGRDDKFLRFTKIENKEH